MAINITKNVERTNIHYWLALKLIPRLAVHKKLLLIREIGLRKLFLSLQTSTLSHLSEKQQLAVTNPNWERIDQIIKDCIYCGCELIGYDDGDYPERLKQIYDPPLVLFAMGNKALLSSPQIAVVGSRGATAMGRENAFSFSKQLSIQGITITSGLALGIDADAHKGALAGGGYTIAVVATGLDRVYPSRHKKLANEILEKSGLIISEFVPGTVPKPGFFPKRNRIISGLSEGVLVVEATIKSGSLITARCALEQNREVFAIPGSIHNPQSKGCHWLIKQGAKLVEECADIIDEVNVLIETSLHLAMNKEETSEDKKNEEQGLFNEPLLDNVGYEVTPIDIVVSRSKLPINAVLTQLTMLELKGLVSSVPGGYIRAK